MSTIVISKIPTNVKHSQGFDITDHWGCYIDNELTFFDRSLEDLITLIAEANLSDDTVLEMPQNWVERAKGCAFLQNQAH